MAGFGVNVEPWNFRVPLIPPGRRRKDLPRKPACYVYGRQHYYAVKMRANRSLKDNPERIAAVHTVFSEPGTIALETGSDWSADIANEFLDTCNMRLMWVEDPAPHSDLHLVRDHPLNTITDGEKAVYASELYELFTRGRLRKLIIDVQYIGGPVRFLEAARALNALGATVGAHRFSHYSVHLLSALPRSLPIEMLDWTHPAFYPLAGPDASGCLPVKGPDFHIDLNQAVIGRHRVRVSIETGSIASPLPPSYNRNLQRVRAEFVTYCL